MYFVASVACLLMAAWKAQTREEVMIVMLTSACVYGLLSVAESVEKLAQTRQRPGSGLGGSTGFGGS